MFTLSIDEAHNNLLSVWADTASTQEQLNDAVEALQAAVYAD